ncbi:MAG: helix-turn-helix domain-containing protein [Pirellulaceae bacterium]|nr:helix-turn-helix domain-containing protein [Pirellulaceae bacterium]
MSNVATALKEEIRRLARKEIRAMVGTTQKAVAQYRRDIAELKRQLGRQDKKVETLKKKLVAQGAERENIEDDDLSGARFSARSVKAQRRRLKLSAADYGKLIGVTALSIYNWESGKSRPRKAQLDALVRIRGIRKRDAAARLQNQKK